MILAQITIPIDTSALWVIIPNAFIIAVFYFAFIQKIKQTVDEKLKTYTVDQAAQIQSIVKSSIESMDKFEIRYEQRLIMMEARLSTNEQNITNTKEIVKTLETHNLHILKAVDDIKESITRLHERLDKDK